MSNRNFNKQTTNARQGFASVSTVKKLTSKLPKPTGTSNPPKDYKKSTSKELKAMEGFRKVSPKLSMGDKMKEYIIGNKETRDKLLKKKSDMRKKKYAPEFKKKSTLLPKSKNSDLTDKMEKMERPRPKKLSESPERIKKQADYMKKHGKNEPRRKTLSVKNTYKKEVEGLKK